MDDFILIQKINNMSYSEYNTEKILSEFTKKGYFDNVDNAKNAVMILLSVIKGEKWRYEGFKEDVYKLTGIK